MKKLLSLLSLLLVFACGGAYAASHAGAAMKSDASACETQAKDKKLAGAAKTSFMKKCEADAGGAAAACEKSAADKKLAGAAKTSHIKKCMADSKTADAKPMADSKMAADKPAMAAKPSASAKK